MVADLLAQLDVPLRPRILSTVPLERALSQRSIWTCPKRSTSSGRPSSSHPSRSRPRAGPCRPSSWIACSVQANVALFGGGFERSSTDFKHLGAHTPRVLAADLPTGVGDQRSVRAIRTITFHQPKLSMYGEDGRLYPEVGALIVAQLPWPSATTDVGPGDALRYPSIDPFSSTKGDRGRVLVIGGGPFHGAPARRTGGRPGWCGSGSCGHAEGCLLTGGLAHLPHPRGAPG